MNHLNLRPLAGLPTHSLIKSATYLLLGVLGVTLLYSTSFAAPYPYTDDWIYASSPPIRNVGEFMRWLLAQHVDHRIPFQKAVQILILRLSGFDYRWLIAVNVLIAVGTCSILIELSKVCRGHRSWIDLCIPLIMLNPALPPFLWGFQMQFAMPTFAFGASMLCMAGGQRNTYLIRVSLAILAALMAAASGMNGVITATISLIAISLMVWMDRRAAPSKGWVTIMLTVSTCIVGTLWLTWTPSSQTDSASVSPSSVWTALQALSSAGLANWLYLASGWKIALNTSVLLLGTAALAWQFYLSPRRWLPMCFIASQSFALLLAAIVGRSGSVEWSWMHALHYGFIATGLVVAALTAISASGVLRALCLPLIAFFGYACWVNTEWRLRTINDSHPHIALVSHALATSYDVDRLADKYLQDFWWVKDDPSGKTIVAEGIRAVRGRGAWLPPPPAPMEKFDESNESTISNLNCNLETLTLEQLGRRRILSVSGWILRADRQGAPSSPVWLVLRDKGENRSWRIAINLTLPRSDIIDNHTGFSTNAGFQAVADVTDLPNTSVPITLDYEDSAKRVICDNGLKIERTSY